jgi:hypothetical protein
MDIHHGLSRRLSYGSSVSSSHVLTQTCLIISSSRRASWSNVMKFKYTDVTFTRKLFHSIQAEALAMPVTSAVFTRLILCMSFCITGSCYRRPRNKLSRRMDFPLSCFFVTTQRFGSTGSWLCFQNVVEYPCCVTLLTSSLYYFP